MGHTSPDTNNILFFSTELVSELSIHPPRHWPHVEQLNGRGFPVHVLHQRIPTEIRGPAENRKSIVASFLKRS